MNALTKMTFLLLFLGAARSFGDTCSDTTYVRMQGSKLGDLTAEDLARYHALDSSCQSERLRAKRLRASMPDRYQDAPYSPKPQAAVKKKSTNGQGWFLASFGVGVVYLLINAVYMASIDDECDFIFVTDLLKSEQDCKEDAEKSRSAAGTGMLLGGILSVVGLAGAVATSNGN